MNIFTSTRCLFVYLLLQSNIVVDSIDSDHTLHSDRSHIPAGHDPAALNTGAPENSPDCVPFNPVDGPSDPSSTLGNHNFSQNNSNVASSDHNGSKSNPDLTGAPLKGGGARTSGSGSKTCFPALPTGIGASATFRLPNNNNSNNAYVDGAAHPAYRSPYQDPRYLIANQGKLPPEASFEFIDDDEDEDDDDPRYIPPDQRRHPKYPDPSYHVPTDYSCAQSIEPPIMPMYVPPTYFGESAPPETPNPTTNQIHLLLLDVNYRETTPGVVLYETLAPNVHKFSAYEPYYIKVVSYGDALIWQAEESRYPIGVVFYEFEDQPTLDLVYEDLGPLSQPYAPTMKPIIIDPAQSMPEEAAYAEPTPASAAQSEPPAQAQPVGHGAPDQHVEPETGSASQHQQSPPKQQKPQIKPKLLTLNLDNLTSSKEVKYRYNAKNNRHTLKAIYPHLFKEVVSGGKVVWSAKGDKYGNKLVIKFDDKGKPVPIMFFPDNIDQPASDPPLNESDPLNQEHAPAYPQVKENDLANLNPRDMALPEQPTYGPDATTSGSGLKFYSDINKDVAVEITPDQFEVEQFDDTVAVFTNHTNCVLVEYDDQTLWRKGEHGLHELTSVNVDLRRNVIAIVDGKKGLNFKKGQDGVWTYFDSFDYKSYAKKQAGAKAASRKRAPKAQPAPAAAPSHESGASKLVQQVIKHPVDPNVKSKLKLFVQDRTDPSISVELTTHTFKPAETNNGLFYEYEFDAHAKCSEVRYKDSVVWRYDPSTPSIYPRGVSWHELYHLVALKFGADFYKFYIKMGREDRWKPIGLKAIQALDLAKVRLYTRHNAVMRELASTDYRFRNLGFCYEFVIRPGVLCHELDYENSALYRYDKNDNRGRHASAIYLLSNKALEVLYERSSFHFDSPSELVLDIGRSVGPAERFSYLQHNKVGTYTPSPGCWFSCVKKGAVVIWSNVDSADYALRVVRRPPGAPGGSDRLKIFLDSGKLINYAEIRNRWTQLSVDIELDVSRLVPTMEYSYVPCRDTAVFMARFNIRFIAVRLGSIKIWSAFSESQYSTRVVRHGDNKLDIHLNDGNVLFYSRLDAQKPWVLAAFPPDLEAVPPPPDQHEFKQQSPPTVFSPRGAPILKTVPEPPSQQPPVPTPVRMPPAAAQPVVKPVSAPVAASPATQPVQAAVTTQPPQKPVNPLINLDIGYVGHSIGYSVTLQGPKKIFRAIPPNLFGKVSFGTELLWRPTSNRYPHRVIYKRVDGQNQVKVYFPDVHPTLSAIQSQSPVKIAPPTPATTDPFWQYKAVKPPSKPPTPAKKPDVSEPSESVELDFALQHEPEEPFDWQVDYITLDVKKKVSTPQFHFFKDITTNTGIYFAKEGYLFSKIKFSQPFYVCLLDLLSIWNASGHCPFAKMIMVNGIDESEPHITIFFTDGTQRFNFMEYYRKPAKKPKPSVAELELNEANLPNVKLYTMTESGMSMNDTSQFTPIMYTLSNSQKVKFPNLISYQFKFHHSNCVKIFINDAQVWAFTDEELLPSSIYYFATLDLVVIEFAYYLFHVYKYDGTQWFLFNLD